MAYTQGKQIPRKKFIALIPIIWAMTASALLFSYFAAIALVKMSGNEKPTARIVTAVTDNRRFNVHCKIFAKSAIIIVIRPITENEQKTVNHPFIQCFGGIKKEKSILRGIVKKCIKAYAFVTSSTILSSFIVGVSTQASIIYSKHPIFFLLT